MDKEFVGQMYQRFGSKASKFGLSDSVIQSAVGVLEKKLEQKQAVGRGSIPAPPPAKSSGFNRSKYPLVK